MASSTNLENESFSVDASNTETISVISHLFRASWPKSRTDCYVRHLTFSERAQSTVKHPKSASRGSQNWGIIAQERENKGIAILDQVT